MLALIGGVFAILLGVAVLVGWILDVTLLKSIYSGFETMKVNSAVLFVLAGAAVCLRAATYHGRARRSIALALSLTVTAVALVTLAEYATGVDLGINQLLSGGQGLSSTSLSGRMAPSSAWSFALVGAAIAVLDAGEWADVLSQVLAVCTLTMGYIAFTGYVYQAPVLYGAGGSIAMALHTSLGLMALSMAVLALQPRMGIAAAVTQGNTAGAMARRLLPVLVVAPIVIGWFRLQGQSAGFYGTEFGLALMVTVTTVVFVNLVLWNARVQGAAEDESLRMAAALRESEERSASVLNSAPDGILVIDEQGCIVEFNLAAERLFGHRSAEVRGRPMVDVVVHPSWRDEIQQQLAEHRESSAACVMLGIPMYHADGSAFPVEMAMARVRGATPPLFTAFLRDLTERNASEAERNRLLSELRALTMDLEQRVETRTLDLAKLVDDKDILLREIHHRVKNNLAIISSLLFLESTCEANAHVSRVCEESRRRVRSMALVHEILYGPGDLGEIDFAEYARLLARELALANGRSDEQVRVITDLNPVKVSIDSAVPCGLILNELMSNAFKHAFPNGRLGEITVTIGKTGENRCLVQIADDGVGLPPALEVDTNRSLGMRLIRLLADQLHGSFEFTPVLTGTNGRLEFPL